MPGRTALSERGGPCRLPDPFAGAAFAAEGLERHHVEIAGDEPRFETTPDQRVVFTRRGD